MIPKGTKVIANSSATLTGTKEGLGVGIIERKVGDVPDFYEVRITGPCKGRQSVPIGSIIKVFVYQEDMLDMPILKVIQGGKK